MDTRPNGLHPTFRTVTIPADKQPAVQRQPHNSIDFVLTPAERSKAAAATVHLEAWRRRQNAQDGGL